MDLTDDSAKRVWFFPIGAKPDVVFVDGSHRYWSTHCRHDNHGACSATELAPGVPREPAQCKTCAAPCLCHCHKIAREG